MRLRAPSRIGKQSRKAWALGRDFLRHFGPRWTLARTRYEAKRRLGLIRLLIPISSWEKSCLGSVLRDERISAPDAYFAYRQTQAPRFFFEAEDFPSFRPLFSRWDAERPFPFQEVDGISQGRYRLFEGHQVQSVYPPRWSANPETGEVAADHQHWSQIEDFAYGDIKFIWELNRFGFVYSLVRAYARTGEARYPEIFWDLAMDWRKHNPPQQGVNWKCGQETSLRVMAWCFGLYAFSNHPSSTPDRVFRLAEMIAASGERIAFNLDYALSQNNNHGVSEGVGLWTIGLLFPEFRSSRHWRNLGKQALEAQAQDLIYEDGAFSQHSFNYQRMILDLYLWAIRLGELNQALLSESLKNRVKIASELLYQLQEECLGRLPRYGQDDGTHILALSNSDYEDFRPVLQAVHLLLRGERLYPLGPWDESALWILGPSCLEATLQPPLRRSLEAKIGGYYTFRTPEGFAFLRCASYKHRPSQADMLHFDLWWRGHNIAIDPGTFSYNAPYPWRNPLAGTAYHNTVSVDGLDQMERQGRFLWIPWLRASLEVSLRSKSGKLAFWQGSHDGYQRLEDPVTHRRAVLRIGEEHWLVLDRLEGNRPHAYRLHWLLPDLPYVWDDTGQLTLKLPEGVYDVHIGSLGPPARFSLVRADPASPRGWLAPRYGEKYPALSVEVKVTVETVTFFSVLGPTPVRVSREARSLGLETGSWRAEVGLGEPGTCCVNSVEVSGSMDERWEVAA